jgi:hypothetical protein
VGYLEAAVLVIEAGLSLEVEPPLFEEGSLLQVLVASEQIEVHAARKIENHFYVAEQVSGLIRVRRAK